jgi:hypothetical protein
MIIKLHRSHWNSTVVGERHATYRVPLVSVCRTLIKLYACSPGPSDFPKLGKLPFVSLIN